MTHQQSLLPVLAALLLTAAVATGQQPSASNPPATDPTAVWTYTTASTQPLGIVTADGNVRLLTDPAAGWQVQAARLIYTSSKSPAAYLGIGVEAPSDALRSQLKLPEGVGLLVNYVDEKGPSHGTIQVHDVLERLDDQLLVNAEQFVTLVRLRKPGGKAAIALVRQSQPVTVSVTLGEKEQEAVRTWRSKDELAELALEQADLDAQIARRLTTVSVRSDHPDRAGLIRRLSLDFNGLPPSPQEVRTFVEDKSPDAVAKLVDRLVHVPAASTTQPTTQPAANQSGVLQVYSDLVTATDAVARASRAGPVTIDDGDTLMWLQPAPAGGAELTVVKRATGEVTFKGPVGTEAQWQSVPDDVRKKLDAWRQIVGGDAGKLGDKGTK